MFTVDVKGDLDIEPDEVFDVLLSDAVNGVVVDQGMGTILDDDLIPPVITEVLISGSTWTSGGAFDFMQYLSDNGLGVGGFRIPDGGAQLGTVSWINNDRITLRFSKAVTNLAGNVEVRGVNGPDGAPGTGDETYNLGLVSSGLVPAGGDGAFQAVYQLTAGSFKNDKLLVDVSDAVTDLVGNALDGEWNNGADTYGSGDNVAGGEFQFRINVLPGDVVSPAFVLSTDVNNVIARAGSSTLVPALYSPRADVDGSGLITSLVVNGVISRAGTSLPPGEPTASAIGPAGAPGEAILLRRDQLSLASVLRPAAFHGASAVFERFAPVSAPVRYAWLDGDTLDAGD